MNYKNFNLGDWIGHISGVIEDETTLDGNEMRDLVEFLTSLKQELTTKNDLGHESHKEWLETLPAITEQDIVKPVLDKIRAEIGKAWHTKPKNRYEEGLRDQALRDMKIIDRYEAESEGNNDRE